MSASNGALNTDTGVMLEGARQLANIHMDLMSSLQRYQTMNQNLTSSGFQGDAAIQSMTTTEDIRRTGTQVTTRFETVINTIKSSAAQYDSTNQHNRNIIGQVAGA
jgi:uncharacterized protein YukE